jgi:hypothetical protein
MEFNSEKSTAPKLSAAIFKPAITLGRSAASLSFCQGGVSRETLPCPLSAMELLFGSVVRPAPGSRRTGISPSKLYRVERNCATMSERVTKQIGLGSLNQRIGMRRGMKARTTPQIWVRSQTKKPPNAPKIGFVSQKRLFGEWAPTNDGHGRPQCRPPMNTISEGDHGSPGRVSTRPAMRLTGCGLRPAPAFAGWCAKNV